MCVLPSNPAARVGIRSFAPEYSLELAPLLHFPGKCARPSHVRCALRYHDPMAATKRRLVLLGVAANELEANVWRDILQADGIPSFVKNTDPFASFGVTPPPGSLELWVDSDDEQRARWLLGERVEAGDDS